MWCCVKLRDSVTLQSTMLSIRNKPAASNEGEWTNVRRTGFFGVRHQYAKSCSIRTLNTIFFINSENFASTGGQSIDTTNTATQNNGLVSLWGSCALESFLSYCTFKSVYIILGTNIGYTSTWKLSAQMTIGSANNDNRERK